ncbi:MAG: hypothetical protein RIR18_2162 [Pseudomonadota bacterium]
MKLLPIFSLALGLLTAFAQPALAQQGPNTLQQPFVTVNGVAQSNALAEVIFRAKRLQGAPDSDDVRQSVRTALIAQAVLEPEAIKAKIDQNPLVQAQIELARRDVLISAWEADFVANYQPSDADLKAEYAAQVAKLGKREVLIRHLLVKDEDTAKAIIKDIKTSVKTMAELAAQVSEDAGTKGKEGLADWAPLNSLSPELKETVKGLNKGKVANKPVKTAHGWHVVKLEDIRPLQAPSLDSVKPQLTRLMAQRALENHIKGLLEQANAQ